MRITVAIDIFCKPEEVFSWIADPNKAMRWQKGVKGGHILRETPVKVGTTFREEMEENGKRLVMTGQITDYIQNQSISFHLDSRIHKVDVTYSIEDNGNGSTFTGESNVFWKFPISLVSLIIGGRIRKDILRQTEAEFAELKRLCETKPQ
jgi:uncharacterized protein YndB with AHSA1/START domain